MHRMQHRDAGRAAMRVAKMPAKPADLAIASSLQRNALGCSRPSTGHCMSSAASAASTSINVCQLSVVRRWAMGDAAIERPLQMRDQLRRGIAEHLAHHVDVPRGENARDQHALGQFQRRRCIAHARGEWAWIVPKLQRCAIAGTHDLLRRAQLTCVAGSGLLKNAASSTVGNRAVGNRPARPCAGARPWCHTRCVGGLRNTSCDTASVAAAHCAVHTLRSVRYFKDTDSTTQKHSTPSAHPRLPCAHAPHVASR